MMVKGCGVSLREDENVLKLGISWLPSGWDSVLSPLRAWIQFLAQELKSHKLQGQNNRRRKKMF